MLFMVGIEVPKSENEAWGIVVPAFERIDLGCVSAVDNESDILIEARDVILSMAEVALEQGFLLSDLAEPYKDYSQEKNLVLKRHKKRHARCLFLFVWWRRRELNPRPSALCPWVYMLSFVLCFNR